MPAGLAVLVLSPISGRLVGKTGTRLPLTLSGIFIALAAVSLTTLTPTTPLWFLLLTYACFGAGFGLVNAPITNTAVSGMPNARAGSAAALASTGRQVGSALGIAIAGSVSGASGSSSVGAGFAVATHPLWWVLVGSGAAVIALAWLSNSAWAASSSKRVAPLLADAA